MIRRYLILCISIRIFAPGKLIYCKLTFLDISAVVDTIEKTQGSVLTTYSSLSGVTERGI